MGGRRPRAPAPLLERPVSAARVAELLRRQARLHGELAEVTTEIADELAGQAPEVKPANDTKPPRRPPVRQPYVPPTRPVSDAARAKASRALKKQGIT